MMACLLGIAQAMLGSALATLRQYEANFMMACLPGIAQAMLGSALATLRHCQPIYELSVIRARV